MKNLLFFLILLLFGFSQCSKKSPSFEERLNQLSLSQLDSIVLNRKQISKLNEIGRPNKIMTPITLVVAKEKVQRYIRAMANHYNIMDTSRVERAVELPFWELDSLVDLLGTFPVYSNQNLFGYRIYFGKNISNSTNHYYTGHTAIVRICYNGINIPDTIPHPTNPQENIATILNVGNICPPNCPGDLQSNDDTFHGPIN